MSSRLYRNISGSGKAGGTGGALIGLRGSLFKMAMTLPPSPPKAREPKRIGGVKLPMTDEQILEARIAYERQGANVDDLAKLYGVSREFMDKVVDYVVRQKLFPPLR